MLTKIALRAILVSIVVMRLRCLVLVVLCLVAGLACAPPSAPGQQRCNGHAQLCERTLDNVVFAGAHNSMSSRDDAFLAPNQSATVRVQLDLGVRAFLIDTKAADEETYPGEGVLLCHAACSLGRISLSTWLLRIKKFIDESPDTVVQLLVQDEASAADTGAVFSAVGLLDELYVHDDGAPWPILQELIENRTRIFVTAESPAVAPEPWFHSMFQLFSDTPFTYSELSEIQAPESCAVLRGSAENDLFLINHWLGPLPAADAADVANTRAVLDERTRRCAALRGRAPTVVAVDFVDHGDLSVVVDGLNGVEPAAVR